MNLNELQEIGVLNKLPTDIVKIIHNYTSNECCTCSFRMSYCDFIEKFYCRFCDPEDLTMGCINCGALHCCKNHMLLKCFCCNAYVCFRCRNRQIENGWF